MWVVWVILATGLTNAARHTMNRIQEEMHRRLSKGLDPLTGDLMTTVGAIKWVNGKCFDETGREVVLDSKQNWVYGERK